MYRLVSLFDLRQGEEFTWVVEIRLFVLVSGRWTTGNNRRTPRSRTLVHPCLGLLGCRR